MKVNTDFLKSVIAEDVSKIKECALFPTQVFSVQHVFPTVEGLGGLERRRLLLPCNVFLLFLLLGCSEIAWCPLELLSFTQSFTLTLLSLHASHFPPADSPRLSRRWGSSWISGSFFHFIFHTFLLCWFLVLAHGFIPNNNKKKYYISFLVSVEACSLEQWRQDTILLIWILSFSFDDFG